MKPREPRRKLVVPARMRMDGRWSDVRILDASSRGFLLHSAHAPPRGSYIEVHRGPRNYVARVMWRTNQRCGVQTQDRVSVDELVKPPEAIGDPKQNESPTIERRSAARAREAVERRGELSKAIGRRGQFTALVVGGVLATAILFAMLEQAFSQPMAQVAAALGG